MLNNQSSVIWLWFFSSFVFCWSLQVKKHKTLKIPKNHIAQVWKDRRTYDISCVLKVMLCQVMERNLIKQAVDQTQTHSSGGGDLSLQITYNHPSVFIYRPRFVYCMTTFVNKRINKILPIELDRNLDRKLSCI